MVSTRKGASASPAKPVPTDRVLAGEHLAITRASCSAESPFTARDLEALTGISAQRCGLVMSFLSACGLVERAPGRGAYRATKAAAAVAKAWGQSEDNGRRALREVWKKAWFARCARSRLAQGPALRIGLVSKLMTLSQVGESRRRHVEVLVDLLVAVGMLLPEDGGYLRWHENPTVPGPRTQVPAPDDDRVAGTDTEGAHAPVAPSGGIPAPRPYADNSAPPTGEDLMSLLSPPVLLADLARLSSEEVTALHGHIRGLAVILAKLRRPPVP